LIAASLQFLIPGAVLCCADRTFDFAKPCSQRNRILHACIIMYSGCLLIGDRQSSSRSVSWTEMADDDPSAAAAAAGVHIPQGSIRRVKLSVASNEEIVSGSHLFSLSPWISFRSLWLIDLV